MGSEEQRYAELAIGDRFRFTNPFEWDTDAVCVKASETHYQIRGRLYCSGLTPDSRVRLAAPGEPAAPPQGGVIIVTGGRHFGDIPGQGLIVSDTLDGLGGADLIVVGDASGADLRARSWASVRKVPYAVFPANWDRFGKAAGPIRNTKMIDFAIAAQTSVGFLPVPVRLIAFPGGRGTAHCIAAARKMGIEVIEVPAPAPKREGTPNG